MRFAFLPLALLVACGPGDDTDGPGTTGPAINWECMLGDATDLDYADQVGCWEDFEKIASEPLDASIPGARSAKTVIDRIDGDRLYFTNSQKYPIHFEFANNVLNGAPGLPPVADLTTFNGIEYFSPDRRFLLGAITYYEEPDVWAYEIAPYDTADADLSLIHI